MIDSVSLLIFLRERLESILARPQMWGPNIAVETQILLILEIRDKIYGTATNRRVFSDFIAKNVDRSTALPLSEQVNHDEFIRLMKKFVDEYWEY